MINHNSGESGYLVNNTMYQVKSVFCETPQAGRLEDKIERLILNASDSKSAL